MEAEALKWGICCAGRISNDFAVCLNALGDVDHKIIAVASGDEKKANTFAQTHSISKHYSTYKDLALDSSIDIVYIGSIHTEHFKLSKMMLQAGKHVLCEKPLCVTVPHTKALLSLAKSKNLFLMEGFWSRCFPAYQKLKELIDSDVIGEVNHVLAQFGKYNSSLSPRMRTKETAGGALFDIGVYPVQFAQFIFDEKPLEQHSYGSLLKEAGVDTECHIFLRYSNNRTALLSTSLLSNLPNEATVCGTKGTIKVCFPFWCPTRVEVCVQYGETITYDFPLPPKPDKKLLFRNSEGLMYEAAEVRNCIQKGLTESPLLTARMSLEISEIINKARLEIGYDLPQDSEDPV